MIVRDLHILAEKRFVKLAPGNAPDDRPTQKLYIAEVLRELREKEDFPELVRRLDPLIVTEEDKRNYPLPEDFPDNFLLAKDKGLDAHCLKLDLGSTESTLAYEPPEVYFSRDFSAETAGTPTAYTIISLSSGRKELWLGPKPDSNSSANYTLIGVYTPADYAIVDQYDLPPIASSGVILWGLLRKMLPGHPTVEENYNVALTDYMIRQGRNKRSRFSIYTPL